MSRLISHSDRLVRSSRQINDSLSPVQCSVPSSSSISPSLNLSPPPTTSLSCLDRSSINRQTPPTLALHTHTHKHFFFAYYLLLKQMKRCCTWYMSGREGGREGEPPVLSLPPVPLPSFPSLLCSSVTLHLSLYSSFLSSPSYSNHLLSMFHVLVTLPILGG